MNDPRNNFSQDPEQFDNEVVKNYVKLFKDLFNIDAEYVRDLTFTKAKENLIAGNGILLLKPGHFVAAIAYNLDKEEIIYHNSWGSQPGNKNNGLFETMNEFEFGDVSSYCVICKK